MAEQSEVDRLRAVGSELLRTKSEYRTEVERLREGIRALAVDLDRGDSIDRSLAADLRALLAPSPAATTGEARANPVCACGHARYPQHYTDSISEVIMCAVCLCKLWRPTPPAPVSSGEAGTGCAACGYPERRHRTGAEDGVWCSGFRPAPVVIPSAEGSES